MVRGAGFPLTTQQPQTALHVRMSGFTCYYDCEIDIEDCEHSATCYICGRCTSGSQRHRSCALAEDEVQELLAGPDESIPTDEQEAEAIEKQRSTPLTLQQEEGTLGRIYGEKRMFNDTYQFHTTETSVDVVFDHLKENYPDVNFLNLEYNRIRIHDYLTGIVSRREFCVMFNQWGDEGGIRESCKFGGILMQKPIYFSNDLTIHHLSCIDMKANNHESRGQRASLRINIADTQHFINFVATHLNFFFCTTCDKFIFDTCERMTEKQMRHPETPTWSKMQQIYSLVEKHWGATAKLTMYANKMVAVVSPQKRRKITHE